MQFLKTLYGRLSASLCRVVSLLRATIADALQRAFYGFLLRLRTFAKTSYPAYLVTLFGVVMPIGLAQRLIEGFAEFLDDVSGASWSRATWEAFRSE